MANPTGPDGRFVAKHHPDDPRECPRCERFLDAEHFYAKGKNEDGSARGRATYCKDCSREMQRKPNGYKARRKRSKAEERMRSAAYYAKLKRDPERMEVYRATRREQARKRYERAKTDPKLAASLRRAQARSRKKRRVENAVDDRIRRRDQTDPISLYPDAIEAFDGDAPDWVPAEPFLAWLAMTFGDNAPPELALLVGHDLERFRRQVAISLGVVDRVVTHGLGRPDLVESLYPFDTYRAGFTRAELNRRLANA